MLSKRLSLQLTFAATAISLCGALVIAGLAPAPATPSSDLTVSAGQRLEPAAGVTAAAAPGRELYVDCGRGSDRNRGTLAKPLRSIRAATARALGLGTVIKLVRGCTWHTTVQLRGDGTTAKPIRLTAYGTGALPVVDGSSAGSSSVVVLAGRHQVVENIRVRNARTNGVEIQGANSRVRSAIIDNAGIGVLFKASGGSAHRVAVRKLSLVAPA